MALATEAAWCAQDQGKFRPYQEALFEKQGQITYNVDSLTGLAGENGLDTAAFSACLSSRVHQDDVEQARQQAASRGINSTPTFVVGERLIEGNQPYEVFQTVINQELAKVQ